MLLFTRTNYLSWKIVLLITRPNPDGTTLLNKILSLGVQAWHYSPLLIEPIPLNENHAQECIDSSQLLIFISPQAVRFLPKLKIGQQKVIAIGKTTALNLQEKGISCHLTPQQENSEGLLAELPPQTVNHKHIVIIKGIGGRDLLSNALKERGAMVTNLDVYKRVPNHERLDSTTLEKIAYIHITSLEIMINLLKNCPENQLSLLKQKTLLLSSARLKEAALQLDFHKFELLADARPDSLLNWARRLKS